MFNNLHIFVKKAVLIYHHTISFITGRLICFACAVMLGSGIFVSVVLVHCASNAGYIEEFAVCDQYFPMPLIGL